MNAFLIFDPKSYRRIKDLAELARFGRQEISQTLKHVGEGKNIFDLGDEIMM